MKYPSRQKGALIARKRLSSMKNSDQLKKPRRKNFGRRFLTQLIFLLVGGVVFLTSFNSRNLKLELDVPVGGEVKIIFVGDMMFDRYIRKVTREKGDDFVFSCVREMLGRADFVVGNLEGPITNSMSKSEGTAPGSAGNFYFTFPIKTAEILARNNFRAVNLGNNHIGNEGREGMVSTKKILTKAGVGYFGGLLGDEQIYRSEKRGQKFSFAGFNQFGGDSPEMVAKKISLEKKTGRMVFVYVHWGEEYSDDISKFRPIAKLFSEAGADAVIGSHSHIILPSERIGDTIVYYSLGNFIFDQYWNEEVRTGMAVLFRVLNGKIFTEEYKTYLESDGRTCLQ